MGTFSENNISTSTELTLISYDNDNDELDSPGGCLVAVGLSLCYLCGWLVVHALSELLYNSSIFSYSISVSRVLVSFC